MAKDDVDLDAETDELWKEMKEHFGALWRPDGAGYMGTYAQLKAMKKRVRARLERIAAAGRRAKP
jgi:hypothetical protein